MPWVKLVSNREAVSSGESVAKTAEGGYGDRTSSVSKDFIVNRIEEHTAATDAVLELATDDPAKGEETEEEGPMLRRGVPPRGVCTLDMMEIDSPREPDKRVDYQQRRGCEERM